MPANKTPPIAVDIKRLIRIALSKIIGLRTCPNPPKFQRAALFWCLLNNNVKVEDGLA
ncbi:MAG: hypothetical protein JKX72_01645 [Robiginitomaculum sp.]|nr:hypothetical protein [Robiginitomaculum sp.]